MKFLKKNWGNIIFILVIALLFIPQTAMPIKVFISRMLSFSPSEVAEEKREKVTDYAWELQTISGDRLNFSQSEGKVIVVNLWATWCPPCVAEMPSLQSLYDRMGDKVDFYFISSEEPEILQRFLQEKKYTIPVYIEIQKPPKALQSRSLPKTYVISKKGEIVINKTGAASWDSEKVLEIVDGLLKN